MKMPKTAAFGKTNAPDKKIEEKIVGNPTPTTTTEGVLKALEVILEHSPIDPFKE